MCDCAPEPLQVVEIEFDHKLELFDLLNRGLGHRLQVLAFNTEKIIQIRNNS